MLLTALLTLTGLGFIAAAPAAADSAPACPGNTTYEMRRCASQQLEQSQRALSEKLSAAELRTWKAATGDLCDRAYRPYRDGSIHGQLVTGCHDRLNKALLLEFRGLEEPR